MLPVISIVIGKRISVPSERLVAAVPSASRVWLSGIAELFSRWIRILLLYSGEASTSPTVMLSLA
jgi:hypothetical protein